jgi:tetratricopeptide (TPR) repeat protein
MANIHLLKGQLDIAEALVRECIEISREIGDTFTIMVGFRRLGLIYLASGQFECAQDAFTESIELCGVNKNNVEMCNSGTRLCLARLHTGRYRQAQNLIKEYKKNTENSGFTRNISLCYLLLGHLALVNTQYTDAQEQTQKGIDILESIGPRRELGPAYADLCLASLRLGDPIQAKLHLRTALDYAIKTGDYVAHVYVLPITALYYAHQGQLEYGRDFYAYANTFPMIANSRWFADIIQPSFNDIHPPSAIAYTPALETDEALHALHAKVRDIRHRLA